VIAAVIDLFHLYNASFTAGVLRNFSRILSLAQRPSVFYTASAVLPIAAVGILSETAYQAPLNDRTVPYATKVPLGRAR
jgi:hypothetical protein